MTLAAKSKHNPRPVTMLKISLIAALNDETAVFSRALDRIISFFHLLFPDGERLQTLNDIEEARDLLKAKLIAEKIDTSTISYYVDGLLKLLSTNNEDMLTISRPVAYLSCHLHCSVHNIPGHEMESTISAAMQLVSEHLTGKEPKDFMELVVDAGECLNKFERITAIPSRKVSTPKSFPKSDAPECELRKYLLKKRLENRPDRPEELKIH